jgi:hypothetical protein
MDEATIIVDKFAETDPEQVRWYDRICESFDGSQATVVATPWDQALANRVPLDLGAVSEAALDAKLAMAEVVLRGVDRANRRRQGLPETADSAGNGQWEPAEPPRWSSQPLPPVTGTGSHVPAPAGQPWATGPEGPGEWIIPAQPAEPRGADAGLNGPGARIIPTQPGPGDESGPGPGARELAGR